jgi:hypothetical protein
MIYRPGFVAVFALFLMLGLLSACSAGLGGGLPTPLPAEYVPTAIALTVEAGNAGRPTPEPPAATETPSETPTEPPPATPSPTPENPIATQPAGPSPTPKATPTGLPIADIQIFRPGNLSKVVSPIKIYANLAPGAGGRVKIELRGEDGRILTEETKEFSAQSGIRINLYMDLEYKMAAVAEAGRLVISVADTAGRLTALNSVDLILLSLGEADYNPASADQPVIVIQQPAPKSLIQGGKVVVSGLAQFGPGGALMVQLIDDKGNVVGSHPVEGAPAPDGGYVPFIVEVPYQVSTLTPVRLSVYEGGDSPATITYLTSEEIMLSP